MVERWITRRTKFFQGVTRNREIRAGLQARGLTAEELLFGWDLYTVVVGVRQAAELLPPPPANLASDAMTRLDAWDGPAFNTMRAILEHRTPKASNFLFAQLSPGKGPKAVVAVERFMARYDRLVAGTAEGVPPSEAQEAVQVLAERRVLDSDTAANLRHLVKTARTGSVEPEPVREAPTLDEATFERYRAWLHEWREVARATFTRRDYLISLGLATRRTNASGEEEVVEDTDLPADDETSETSEPT